MTNELSKQTKNNGLLTVREIPVDLAKDLIVTNHYSHKWAAPFGLINYGIFKDGSDECLGAAVFGHLMNPNSFASICEDIEKGQIVELNRLWLSDVLGMNAETTFLAMCFKLIKRNYPHIKLVQSFADGRLGCGTIYKAANFKYYGKLETLFFEDIHTGEVTHKTLFEDTRSLATLADLNYQLASGKLRPFNVVTYRYIYALDRKYERKIKLKERSYPEYSKGLTYLPDYKQALGPLARAYFAFLWMGMDANVSQISEYIHSHYGELSPEELRSIASSKTMDLFFADEDKAALDVRERYAQRLKRLNRTEDAA